MQQPVSLSIIIPAFNEAARITRTLQQIVAYLQEHIESSEVIVVDDGSTDETVAVVEQFLSRHPNQTIAIQLIQNHGNKGKGYSVKNGVLHARGEIVAFTDADLSSPIAELPKLLDPIRRGECDIVIGSRAVDRSLIGEHQSLWRELAGRTFNLIMRFIIGLSFKDTQCGFKAYRHQAVLPIFELQQIKRFSFDVEVLYLAQKRGLRIKEVPVVWNHAEGSRVHMVKDSLRMFLELLKIRWYALVGRYN
jgi:glycosyltransferase involved in cell wall biosynthesis